MNSGRNHRLWRAWVAAAAVLVAAQPAPAFYWALKGPPSVITEFNLGKPGNPPSPVTDPIPLPPGNRPPSVPGTPLGPETPDGPGPVHTPEPATAVIGLIGLGAVAASRWVKRRRQ